jgi:O-antigen/teichoic acid export membrane protein
MMAMGPTAGAGTRHPAWRGTHIISVVSLKANVVANILGQLWRALLSIGLLPIYIHYLGIESFGLIGIFAALQAWLFLLDLGLRPALNREMARFGGGSVEVQAIRDLLYSIALIGLVIAAAIATGVFLAAPSLAVYWIADKSIPVDVVQHALTAMGLVVGIGFVENIYVSALAGLQRQVMLNLIHGLLAAVRGLGAIAILAWVSPTIQAFFFWQGASWLLSLALMAYAVYRLLPAGPRAARFSRTALVEIWPFASGMIRVLLLAVLLTHIDKLVLPRLLTLEAFGYYTLAASVANTLFMAESPITAALYPRFTELAACGNVQELCRSYHYGAQLVSAMLGPAAAMLVIFGERALVLWTGNHDLSLATAPLLAALTIGTLLKSTASIPNSLQLAYGYTALAMKVNAAAVAVVIPAFFLVVPTFGALGAAFLWAMVNLCYVTVFIALMHRRLLPNEMWRWYRDDVGPPVGAAFLACALARMLLPGAVSPLAEFTVLASAALLAFAAAILSASLLRARVVAVLCGLSKQLSANHRTS